MAFRLYIFFLVFISSVLPMMYLFSVKYFSVVPYFAVNLISDEALYAGHIYTVLASLIFFYCALTNAPRPLSQGCIDSHQRTYQLYGNVLFYLAFFSLFGDIVKFSIFGGHTLNLTPQIPQFWLYWGYLTRIIGTSIFVLIFYQVFLYGKLQKSGMLILLMYLLMLSLTGSRFGMVSVLTFYMVAIAYSIRSHKLNIRHLFVLSTIGLASLLLGQYIRSGDLSTLSGDALLRFYFNNQALYLGLTDYDKLFNILMENQPWVMLDQMFSFLRERTLLPSSFRLLEFWGGEITVSDKGHIAGYVYGWLGLSYGIFNWFGLLFLFIYFKIIFNLLNKFRERPSLYGVAFFVLMTSILHAFFGNLGLDQVVEHIFKGIITTFIFLFIMYMIKIICAKPKVLSVKLDHKSDLL